ncbi:hypothetical protein CR513_37986 [Mucuna pruriens]|uniref:PHD-type zinc finger plants domain-containing protein n=1 Tax=Mucuna pruriens TaxID=157652 RepID=A0A371FSL8_MUCPR|nr:hypothetical protein CR513_37986 [Mucuna pruriens]
MVDLQTVCCMCGDVGFPDKLFRCNKCHHRFQHSYCSNYYGGLTEIEVCDWCQSEGRSSRHNSIGSNSKKVMGGNDGSTTNRSEYSGEKIKQHEESGSEKGKSPTPSPRPSTRRYKLLKDVMC